MGVVVHQGDEPGLEHGDQVEGCVVQLAVAADVVGALLAHEALGALGVDLGGLDVQASGQDDVPEVPALGQHLGVQLGVFDDLDVGREVQGLDDGDAAPDDAAQHPSGFPGPHALDLEEAGVVDEVPRGAQHLGVALGPPDDLGEDLGGLELLSLDAGRIDRHLPAACATDAHEITKWVHRVLSL